jgi:D-alanyl-D-alanine carboxypeptidase
LDLHCHGVRLPSEALEIMAPVSLKGGSRDGREYASSWQHTTVLALAVAVDGQTLLARGYGVTERGKPEAVDENTVFGLASTTKAFTAAALGILVNDGILGWDDLVVRHLGRQTPAGGAIMKATCQRLLEASVLFSAVTVSCTGEQTAPTPLPLQEQLQAALDEGFAQVDGKGVSVAVVIPGAPMWTGVAGVSHSDVPIAPRTVFAAGSLTKTFTALTVLRLTEDGYLSLDDSLHSWLPEYPHVDRDITIRKLLNHTSGLSDFADQEGWIIPLLDQPDRVWGMEEYFLQTIRAPYFEKGTGWSYSTSGYLLLRMIIEQATGSTVAAQYKKYVFDPLGLHDTYVCPDDPLPSEWAHGWLDINGDNVYDDFSTIPNISFCSATGGQIYTTAADLATLGNALMHDRTILQDTTYDEMTDFYFPTGHDEPLLYGYGLGLLWFNPDFVSGEKVWGHSGNAPAYAAAMLYMVDHGVVVSLMDNTHEGEAVSVAGRIFDVIMRSQIAKEQSARLSPGWSLPLPNRLMCGSSSSGPEAC